MYTTIIYEDSYLIYDHPFRITSESFSRNESFITRAPDYLEGQKGHLYPQEHKLFIQSKI